ncbi:hypothetical protein ACFL08_03600 [Patescibacteria group bacterium]
MELMEYVGIFRKNLRYFLVTVLLVLVIGFGIHAAMPNNYKVTLDLNVTRTGKDLTNDYRYDSFYRLQADERFADTVVKWLGSERVKADIREHSKSVSDLNLKARRLSSQMIEVTFIIPVTNDAERVTDSIIKFVNGSSQDLNKYQQEKSWFKVIANNPFVAENKIGFLKLFLICLGLGVFAGFWTVLVKYYFSRSN